MGEMILLLVGVEVDIACNVNSGLKLKPFRNYSMNSSESKWEDCYRA